MAWAGQVEGTLMCVWMRGERGSPGSPSEMSLPLPGPRENLSLRRAPPFPWRLKSGMILSELFICDRPDSILKSRDITLPTKVHLVKAVVFPVVMYGCEVGLCRRLSAKELMLLNCGVGEDS